MSAPMLQQMPFSLGKGQKREMRSQFAALCYRVKNGKTRILLTTSRRSGRWIVPKGWPIDGKTPAECAAQEAWEEAGVIGKVRDTCIGLYSYHKILPGDDGLPCVAMIYPLQVVRMEKKFPEAEERSRKWLSRKKAALMVDQPELARIIHDFDPRRIR